jgi:hypothetical protein
MSGITYLDGNKSIQIATREFGLIDVWAVPRDGDRLVLDV